MKERCHICHRTLRAIANQSLWCDRCDTDADLPVDHTTDEETE